MRFQPISITRACTHTRTHTHTNTPAITTDAVLCLRVPLSHTDSPPPLSPDARYLASTFRRPNGCGPKYSTCWISLGESSPDNGCLYVIPRCADPAYTSGDCSPTTAAVLSTVQQSHKSASFKGPGSSGVAKCGEYARGVFVLRPAASGAPVYAAESEEAWQQVLNPKP